LRYLEVETFWELSNLEALAELDAGEGHDAEALEDLAG
jgi:hypothetical protein